MMLEWNVDHLYLVQLKCYFPIQTFSDRLTGETDLESIFANLSS